MSRFAVSEELWDQEQDALAARLRGSARGKMGLPFINLLPLPELAGRVADLGAWLRFEGTLPGDIRELVVLAVAEHWRCSYEWTGHARLAQAAGLSPATLSAMAMGGEGPELSAEQRTAAAAARSVLRHGKLDDRQFAELTSAFGREGALELAALCGYYGMLAMVINTGFADAEQPDWAGTVGTSLKTPS